MTTTLQRVLDSLGTASKPLYTLGEVGITLNLSLEGVRNLIKGGRLRAVKTGQRKWGYVLHEDLDNYLTALNGGAK